MIIKNFNLKFTEKKEDLLVEEVVILLNQYNFDVLGLTVDPTALKTPLERSNYYLKSIVKKDFINNYDAIIEKHSFLPANIVKEIINLKFYTNQKNLVDFLFSKKIELSEKDINIIINKKFQL